MNYIQSLQESNKVKSAALGEIENNINEFLKYLNSEKFIGVESNGKRKDWISTDDVKHFLFALRSQTIP